MADMPRFGQDRIKDIPPLNLLDALYAQGISTDYLRQLIGMRTPEITSFLIRNNVDRNILDRAVNMASGKEIEKLAGAKTDYDKLRVALESRGMNLSGYRGAKDVNELANWAGKTADPQIFGNAVATALPGYKALGGHGIGDEARKMVTGFSAPTPPGESPGVTTTRGIPSSGGQGVRGQGGATGVPGEKPGTPAISGQVPGAGGPAPGGGGGPDAGGTPPPAKLTPAQIRADIEAQYGWAAALMDIPEIAKIMDDAAAGRIDATEANRRWLGSDYYKSTSVNQRNWRILERTSPAEAAYQFEGQVDSIIDKAQTQGITIDPARARQIATVSKTNGWSDQQISAALASEVKWDPQGAKTGTMAVLKAAVQNQLVPMSDQAMTQWAQAVVSGAKTTADFDAYLKDQAKSLFPSMAQYLDTTPGGNVKTYLDPYAQTIGKTLGTNPADIDWMDPKWYRFVNQNDPKTGERGVMNIADVQRTLIADPQYGYDQTAGGKQQKAGLARTILEQWGYVTPAGAQNGGGF